MRERLGLVYDAGMTVYLDDEAVDLAGQSLEALLESAKQRLEPEGRVVVEVALDGQTLDAEALERQHETPLAEASEVRLYTADPVALATSTLEQVQAALSHAGELQEQASDLLQADEANAALEKVGQAVEIWLQVQQAVLNAALLAGVELDSLVVEGEPMNSLTDELIDRLNHLKDTIGNQDMVGLADTLGYEWPTVVERWDRLITELIQRIQQRK